MPWPPLGDSCFEAGWGEPQESSHWPADSGRTWDCSGAMTSLPYSPLLRSSDDAGPYSGRGQLPRPMQRLQYVLP